MQLLSSLPILNTKIAHKLYAKLQVALHRWPRRKEEMQADCQRPIIVHIQRLNNSF